MFEKIKTGGLVAVIALSATSAWAAAPAAHDHDHGDHGAEGAKIELNDGKKWQTDAVMKANMEALRNDLAGSIDAIHHHKFKPEQYRALAATLEKSVTTIIAECKLEPAVDAQFHNLLPELFGGINAMKGEGDQRAGAVRILGALQTYAQYFEHPNWKPVAH